MRNGISTLSVLLYLHDFADTSINHYLPHYVPNIRGSRGAKVLIHEANTYPDIHQGFNIGPGRDVAVNVKMEKIKRMKFPYERCTDEQFLDDINNLPLSPSRPRYKYDVNTAISRCQQIYTIKSCGCYDPYLPLTSEILYEYIFEELGRIQRVYSCYTLSGSKTVSLR